LSPIGVLFDCPSRNDPSGYLQYERWELGCFMHWGTCQNSQEKVYQVNKCLGLTEVLGLQGAASPTDRFTTIGSNTTVPFSTGFILTTDTIAVDLQPVDSPTPLSQSPQYPHISSLRPSNLLISSTASISTSSKLVEQSDFNHASLFSVV
jgi:hypothetical protein